MNNATRGARAVGLALALLAAAPSAAQAGWSHRMHWRGLHSPWLMHHGAGAARAVPTGERPGRGHVRRRDPDGLRRQRRLQHGLGRRRRALQRRPRERLRRARSRRSRPALRRSRPRSHARTLYVANVDEGTVSVFDVATCNAIVSSGCGGRGRDRRRRRLPARHRDRSCQRHACMSATTTTGALALIDGTTCNRRPRPGAAWSRRRSRAEFSSFPFADPGSRTIYVPVPDRTHAVMTVVNARTCNARRDGRLRAPRRHRGRRRAEASRAGCDPMTRTVYVGNADDDTVSVFDAARCNGTVTAGCGDAPALIPVAPNPRAGSPSTRSSHTLYVPSDRSDVVSVVDTAPLPRRRQRRAATVSGRRCRPEASRSRSTSTSARARSTPRTSPTTRLGVLDASVCSALRDNGCRHPAPAFDAGAAGETWRSIARSTPLYAVRWRRRAQDRALRQRALLTKRASRSSRSRASAARRTSRRRGHADDLRANQDDETIALIDAPRATIGAAPAAAPRSARRSRSRPATPASRSTRDSHAVYVTAVEAGRLYRIDGAHCRIGDRSRCTPVSGPVGEAPVGSRGRPATGTVYVTNDVGHGLGGRRPLAAAQRRRRSPSAADRRTPRSIRHAHALRRDVRRRRAGKRRVVDTRACNARVTSGCGADA